jgi:hypothetical protein
MADDTTNNTGTQGGTHEQHVKAGSMSSGGSHADHVRAGKMGAKAQPTEAKAEGGRKSHQGESSNSSS